MRRPAWSARRWLRELLHLAGLVWACWLFFTLGQADASGPQPAPTTVETPVRAGPVPRPAQAVRRGGVVGPDPGAGLISAETEAARIAEMTPALLSASSLRAIESLLAPWTTPQAARSLATATWDKVEALRAEPSGPSGLWVAPMAIAGKMTGPAAAEVRVLCSEVVLRAGEPAYSTWVIEDMTLLDTGSGWLLSATADSPAPVLPAPPGAIATPAPEAAAVLAGFGALPTPGASS